MRFIFKVVYITSFDRSEKQVADLEKEKKQLKRQAKERDTKLTGSEGVQQEIHQ